ncbi:MAG TPA: 50S ribosomal protein L10 [Gemmataceae bacterium]|nr:50S ribosomal protein L10 [Gemmataceae bacterium]
MSKQIKQMEMDALKNTFKDVRDMVVLSASKLNCQLDYHVRSTLRKKNIRLQVVKNSLARRVFDECGLKMTSVWEGPTWLAWGGSSLAELSKELDALIKKNDKILKAKGAVSEGLEISFKAALAMPTKAEAIGRVVGLALSPAARILGQILAPASIIAGQIKTLAERPAEQPEVAAPAAG